MYINNNNKNNNNNNNNKLNQSVLTTLQRLTSTVQFYNLYRFLTSIPCRLKNLINRIKSKREKATSISTTSLYYSHLAKTSYLFSTVSSVKLHLHLVNKTLHRPQNYRLFFSLPDVISNSVIDTLSSKGTNNQNQDQDNSQLVSCSDTNSQLLENSGDVLDLFGLKFMFYQNSFRLARQDYTALELLQIWATVEESFQLITQKGYIPEKADFKWLFTSINKYLKDLGYKTDLVLGSNENTFTLWFNLVKLNLYFLGIKVLEQSRLVTFEDVGLDQLSDLEQQNTKLFSSLDPFLRIQIQKRGISIIQNTYTGFDTEYTLANEKKFLNRLLSVQYAVQSRTIIKVPLYHLFDIAYVHPLTSDITPYYKPKITNWDEIAGNIGDGEGESASNSLREMEILNASLKLCVENIRKFKFFHLDNFNRELIVALENLGGVKQYKDLKKDQIVFILPLSKVNTHITYPQENEGYSLKELVYSTNALTRENLSMSFKMFMNLVKNLSVEVDFSRLLEWNSKCTKARGRTTITFFTNEGEKVKVSLNLVRNNYIIAHYNAADLSMLNDFNTHLDSLNIVGKSFVTLKKPLNIEGSFIYLRDSHLLTPAGVKSLDALGKLYGKNVNKHLIKQEDLEHMDEFMLREPGAFEAYAKQDAVIPLIHATTLEDFYFDLKKTGVPITLSAMGKSLVLEKWGEIFQQYFPYQISGEVLMGNASEIQTPKGLFATGDTGLYLSHYISNYKGGRNESFMFGAEGKIQWWDYDLVGAYTTAMTNLSLPDYNQARLLDEESFKSLTNDQLLKGYYILNGSFKFPEVTKYPSIPCYLDKTTTVYPLQGKCTLTGPEYLLSRIQGCEVKIKSCFYIPDTERERRIPGVKKPVIYTIKPFYTIVSDLQAKRREHPKGHIMNALYKEMANSIYGNVVRGISNKKTLDLKTGDMFRITGTDLSNPILASWTTAFIRSVIGECLHNIHKLGGKVVSTTTDGFITDILDLESKLSNLPQEEIPLFSLFKKLRIDLTGSETTTSLEIKHKSKGIISWSTRGQLGVEQGIKATTGFQSGGYTQTELVDEFKKVLGKKDKSFEFTLATTRSAKEIYKKGGQVTLIRRDQKVRLQFDNRRAIQEPKDFEGFDMSNNLFDSLPHKNIVECSKRRFLSKFIHTTPYLKSAPARDSSRAKYKSKIEVGVRNFIKGYLAKVPLFGFKGNEFKCYRDIINFIIGCDHTKEVRISKQSISWLKNRQTFLRPVPKTSENEALASYIKAKFPYFDITSFLK
jgi:hypothetical protein